MREPNDALRSLKKYVAMALDGDAGLPAGRRWEVRLEAEEGTFSRPFCAVGSATPGTIRQRGPYHVEWGQTFQVTCHPVEYATADEARLEAGRVVALLARALAGPGVMTSAYGYENPLPVAAQDPPPVTGPTVRRGHPFRIPLWDWDGVPLTETVGDAERVASDFMRVPDPPTIAALPDPNDHLLWAVVAEIRMWWTRSTAVLSENMIVSTVDMEAS